MTDTEIIRMLRAKGMKEAADRFASNANKLKAYKMAYKSASTKLAYYKIISEKAHYVSGGMNRHLRPHSA